VDLYGEAPVMEAGAKDWTMGEERTGAMRVLILVCAILLCWILVFEMFDSNGEGLVCCYLRVCILELRMADKIGATTTQIVKADLISFDTVQEGHDVYLPKRIIS
jgi:hypothetical protein